MTNRKLPDILESDEDRSSVYSEEQSETPLLGQSSDTHTEIETQSQNHKGRIHSAFDWCSCLGCVASFVAVIIVAAVVAIPLVCVRLGNGQADDVQLYWHSEETMKMDIDPLLYTGFHLKYSSSEEDYVATAYLFDQCPPLVPVKFEFSDKNKPISNTQAYVVYYYLRNGSQVNVSVCTFTRIFFRYDIYVLKGDENYEKWLSFAQLNAVQHWTPDDVCNQELTPGLYTYDVEDDDYYFFLVILGFYSWPTITTVSANFTVQSLQYNVSAVEPKDLCTTNATSRECTIYVPAGFTSDDCTMVTVENSNKTSAYKYTDIDIISDRSLNVWLLVLISVLGLVLIVGVCVSIICCVRCNRRRQALKRKAAVSDLIIQ